MGVRKAAELLHQATGERALEEAFEKFYISQLSNTKEVINKDTKGYASFARAIADNPEKLDARDIPKLVALERKISSIDKRTASRIQAIYQKHLSPGESSLGIQAAGMFRGAVSYFEEVTESVFGKGPAVTAASNKADPKETLAAEYYVILTGSERSADPALYNKCLNLANFGSPRQHQLLINNLQKPTCKEPALIVKALIDRIPPANSSSAREINESIRMDVEETIRWLISSTDYDYIQAEIKKMNGDALLGSMKWWPDESSSKFIEKLKALKKY